MGYHATSNHHLLSADEERSLGRQIAAARVSEPSPEATRTATAARLRLIECNMRLAMKMARRHPAPGHVDREDMIQDALVGLDRAARDFDWRKGFRFSTYASWWIRQAIQAGLENTATPVRIPAQRSLELHAALHDVNGDSRQLSGRLGATHAIASTVGLDMAPEPQSPHEPLSQVILDNDRRAARALLEQLDPTSRSLVERRFGFNGHEPATFAELASDLGVSAEAARRRVHRSLKRLKPTAAALAA